MTNWLYGPENHFLGRLEVPSEKLQIKVLMKNSIDASFFSVEMS